MTTKKAESSMFPPIQITLNGKSISIEKVPYRVLKKVNEEGDKLDADEQLSLLSGISVKELEEADAREIAFALRTIFKELLSPFVPKTDIEKMDSEKNGSSPTEKSSA